MGIKALRKIQLGAESSAGTLVPATTIWRGMGVLSDDRETVFVEEDVGYLVGTNRTMVPKLEASLSMDAVPATYEQLPYILEAGIELETPSQDGTGSDYIYTYNIPTTASPTIRTYTLEGGDDVQEEEFGYGFVTDFTLAGAGGEAVTMAANWVGRELAEATFTGALTLPAVDSILFGNHNLYVDNSSTYPATTQLTSILHAFTLSWTTGLTPKYLGDGSLYFTTHFNQMADITLSLTLASVADAYTQKDSNWRSETAKAIRLQINGPSVTTAGATYSTKTLIIDLAGKWESFSPLSDIDGNNTMEAVFRAQYDGTAAAAGRIIVVNELSALT